MGVKFGIKSLPLSFVLCAKFPRISIAGEVLGPKTENFTSLLELVLIKKFFNQLISKN